MNEQPISASDFQAGFGESIVAALDLDSWRLGGNVEQEYRRLEREVKDAVGRETTLQAAIRKHIFPRVAAQQDGPKNAGVQQADPKAIEKIHRDVLFNGGVEAAEGAIQIHDTLPLTIHQFGVALVSYRGNEGTWSQQLFRRNLTQSLEDRFEAVLESLEKRTALNDGDGLGELVQKAYLAWAERAVLLDRATARWRMGRGELVPYDLLTGGASVELMEAGITALRGLIEKHQRFVFVARESREEPLRTIGHALRPLEFAIVSTLDMRLEHWLHQKRFAVEERVLKWDDELVPASKWIPRFIQQVASKVVVGVFRAGEIAPPQVFYAHQDHADLAAHIALADAMLQEQRGAPMLLEMARSVCNTVFGDSLDGLAANAYSAAGQPWRSSR